MRSPRLLLPFALLLAALTTAAEPPAPIDRHALVTRHNPVVRHVDPDAPLTVGNGNFAFGCDITGLQTFAEFYQRNGVPVETLSRWCWVSDPNPHGYALADANKDFTSPGGRVLGFPTRASTPAGTWLRQNPRAHPLGQLALEWDKPDGSPLVPADIQEPEQTLDLWTGLVTSRYRLGGVPVTVTTACHPQADAVAVRIESELVRQGKLRVRLAFPRGHDLSVKHTPPLDWSRPEEHESTLVDPDEEGTGVMVRRRVGDAEYVASLCFGNGLLKRRSPHLFEIYTPEPSRVLDFGLWFAGEGKAAPTKPLSITSDSHQSVPGGIFAASAAHWESFWRTGAAVDFSGSTNPLAAKLEQRVILSRYLMAVQMAGDTPPQESGLTCNTWYGKHHTEMIWWHAAHFALWGHNALLERNLDWYRAQLPAARDLAASRGLRGARWAKMTGPELRESPGGNPLIIWNQPHPIHLCELLYRANPTPATLAKYRDLVLESADCLAAMAWLDPQDGAYHLGPPLWIAQEIHDPATSRDPSFELAYWRWALGVAQQWRERLGLPRDAHWDDVAARLAPLPQKDGKYVALASHPDTWDNLASRHDHPEMLMPLGFLPAAPGVDPATMARTLDAVLGQWDWETKIWGWDYPMIAMTATRLGRPDIAVEVLLRDGPNNRYLPTGHCPQRSDEALRPDAPPGRPRREIAAYLPANGAFLAAVALMVAGWDGCTESLPGFPKDGTWQIRAEGLQRSP